MNTPSCRSLGICSSEKPSSSNEHIIPLDSTPLNFTFLILESPGKTAFGLATATYTFWRMCGAPHTICNVSEQISTLQTFNLSSSGCFSHDVTYPVTPPLL